MQITQRSSSSERIFWSSAMPFLSGSPRSSNTMWYRPSLTAPGAIEESSSSVGRKPSSSKKDLRASRVSTSGSTTRTLSGCALDMILTSLRGEISNERLILGRRLEHFPRENTLRRRDRLPGSTHTTPIRLSAQRLERNLQGAPSQAGRNASGGRVAASAFVISRRARKPRESRISIQDGRRSSPKLVKAPRR